MRIQILYFDGCPSHDKTLGLLEQVLKEEGIDTPVERIDVNSPEMAQEVRFLGSPSIRVNGRDIENETISWNDFGIRCRIYKGEKGPSGIPTEALIRAAIAAAKKNIPLKKQSAGGK